MTRPFRGMALAGIPLMSIATQTSTAPHESHDATRVTPPVRPEVDVPERISEPDPVDEVLENPYDNIACTD